MENPSNNNKLQILDPLPLTLCLPGSESSNTPNVSPFASSSVTHLRNHHMYDPRLSRLTLSSQAFAGHVGAHYRNEEDNASKVAKLPQELPQLTEAETQPAKDFAQAKVELEKARAETAEQALLLAQAKAKEKEKAQAAEVALLLAGQAKHMHMEKENAPAPALPPPPPKPRAWAPVRPAPAPAGAAAPVVSSSGSGKCQSRTNDVHLRLVNFSFGSLVLAGDKNNSVSTNRISNAMDFLYPKRRIIQNFSSADVRHHQVVPPGFASSSSSPMFIFKKQEKVGLDDVLDDLALKL